MKSCASPPRLRGMGIGKGDRITIYMPTSPEAILLMLASVRIGAIHSSFSRGSANALSVIASARAARRLVFTTDVTFRKGKDVPLEGSSTGRSRASQTPWSTWFS